MIIHNTSQIIHNPIQIIHNTSPIIHNFVSAVHHKLVLTGLLVQIISWKPVILKSPIGFKYPNLLIKPIRITGFHHAKQQQSMAALWWVGVPLRCLKAANAATTAAALPPRFPPRCCRR